MSYAKSEGGGNNLSWFRLRAIVKIIIRYNQFIMDFK